MKQFDHASGFRIVRHHSGTRPWIRLHSQRQHYSPRRDSDGKMYAVDGFSRALAVPVAGLTVAMLIYGAGFVAVGGETFLMWQSRTRGGSDAARLILLNTAIIQFCSFRHPSLPFNSGPSHSHEWSLGPMQCKMGMGAELIGPD
jgi:hypothetical protein